MHAKLKFGALDAKRSVKKGGMVKCVNGYLAVGKMRRQIFPLILALT